LDQGEKPKPSGDEPGEGPQLVMREQKITLGEMRASGALPGSWSTEPITNARIRSRSTPIAGRIMSGCLISNRSSPVRLAATAAPMSGLALNKTDR
jgi:hypothetical protein